MYTKALLLSAIATMASAQTLESVLEGQSDTLSSFAQYVTDAGLLDTINSLGDVTIFAPTNEAFQAALETFPDLVSTDDSDNDSDNDDSNSTTTLTDAFVNLLRYHVVPGAAHATDDWLPYPGSFYPTAFDGIVVNPYTTENDGAAVFSQAKRTSQVVASDISFGSGVIHTIDSVLLPPDNANMTAYEMGFLYFYGAIQRADLVQNLISADKVTLFIPQDQAFINVGSVLQNVDAQTLETIISFHAVVDNIFYTINLSDSDTLNTLASTSYDSGIDIIVDESDGALYANNARIITPNILLSNGVAHLIDEVLNPENDNPDLSWNYDLDEDEGEGVPAFEDASSASIPALTSGVPEPTSTFSPMATFSAVSGAETSYKLNGLLSLCAIGFGLLFV